MQIVQKSANVPFEATFALKNIESPWFLVNFIGSNLVSNMNDRQRLLEIDDIVEFSVNLLQLLNNEMQMVDLKQQIHGDLEHKQEPDRVILRSLDDTKSDLAIEKWSGWIKKRTTGATQMHLTKPSRLVRTFFSRVTTDKFKLY